MKNALIHFYIFSLISTLFLGICFTSADFLTIPVEMGKDLLVIAFQWAVVTIALFFLITLLAANKYIFAITFPLLTFLSSLLAWFRLTMNSALTPMILDAALENDIRTSGDLCSPGLIIFVLVTFALSIAFAIYRIKRIATQTFVIPACVSALLLVGMLQINAVKPISERIPFNIYYTFMKYWEEKQVISEDRTDLTEGIQCCDEEVTVVFVLGESLRPDHLGLNGYERNTTPLLAKEEVISFPYVYTEQTYTNRSVPHLLTRADSTDYSRAYTEKSFVSFFNACDFYTVWLANQEAADTYVYFKF
ncbi:sulfatase-like hydrolase/transferase [Parabacteroides sp.]